MMMMYRDCGRFILLAIQCPGVEVSRVLSCDESARPVELLDGVFFVEKKQFIYARRVLLLFAFVISSACI
jgi:hypothetical protein